MTRSAIACAFFFLSFHATAQTYLSCDFENGIPAEFTLHDYDRNEPSASGKKFGFAVGIPWIQVATNKAATAHAACSTSWYANAGTSDDWMITPAITLSGSNPVLTWKAMASDAKHADGYAVYVSETAGKDKADFNVATPLFSVAKEDANWTEHTVSLSQYKGKTITIAFVNNSTDCSRLLIDNLTIEENHKLNIAVDLPTGINYMGDVTLSGMVSTRETEPVCGFTVGLEANGETTTQHFDAVVTASEPAKFTLDRKLSIGKHETLPYNIWVEADGDRNTISRAVTSYPQKAVCEEGTATWCGWCVRGIVMLDSIKKNYGDRIIGIAAHQGDVMASDYISGISGYLGSNGLPAGTVSRRQSCDPKNFVNFSLALLNYGEILSDIDLKTNFDKTTRTVTATTTIHFAEAQKNNNLALTYAILENRVHKPGNDSYKQHNSYADGEHGVMGGYEQYGEYIPSEVMYFNDVARGYVDDILGIDGSIPADIDAGQPVVDERSFTLPDNILVDDNVEIVALLIDKKDGRIVNGQNVELVPGSVTGINTVANTSALRTSAVYSVNGMRINGLTKGINLIRTSDGRTVKVTK